MKSDIHAWHGRDGLTLFVVVLVLAAMGILGLTILSLAKLDVEVAGQYKKATDALYQADAGVQYVLGRIRSDYDAGTLDLTDPVETINYTAPAGFTFDPVTSLTQLPDGKSYVYSVTGRAQDSRATIEAIIQRPRLFDWDVFGEQTVKFSGNSWANGDLRSDMDIDLTGPVNGDATPGPGYAVAHPEVVTGATTPATETVTLDPVDPADLANAQASNNNASIDPSYLSGTELAVGSDTLTLAPGVYYFTKAVFSGGAVLEVTGPTTIYCTGEFTVSGGGITNPGANPNLLVIYHASAAKIKISGGSASYAHIYAPDTDLLEVSGGGTYYGRLISGGKVTFSGGSGYGGNGGGGGGSGADITILSWKQVAQ